MYGLDSVPHIYIYIYIYPDGLRPDRRARSFGTSHCTNPHCTSPHCRNPHILTVQILTAQILDFSLFLEIVKTQTKQNLTRSNRKTNFFLSKSRIGTPNGASEATLDQQGRCRVPRCPPRPPRDHLFGDFRRSSSVRKGTKMPQKRGTFFDGFLSRAKKPL